ncbi:MAG TPA: hypothetical protein VKB76_18500, partial [Ktedonobacterales bacterium]|nr:hypothetical protein [Ktedonobacterales bacterium]
MASAALEALGLRASQPQEQRQQDRRQALPNRALVAVGQPVPRRHVAMRQADRSREVVRPNYLVDCPTRVAVVDPMLAEWGIGEGLGQRVALPILVVDRPMRVGVAQAILFAVVVWSAGDSLLVGWLAAPNHRRLPDVM